MKSISLIAIAVLMLAVSLVAQQPSNVYAAGISYNSGASPSVAGTALYAHLVADNSGTYAFGIIDALPATVKPFTVTTNVGTGIAQKVFSLGSANVYIPTAAGVSFSGTNTGWQWSTGALVSFPVKGNFRIMPGVRVIKSSVSGGTGYQPVASILFGWGK